MVEAESVWWKMLSIIEVVGSTLDRTKNVKVCEGKQAKFRITHIHISQKQKP